MADIFISYSRRDSTFADYLRNALVAQGRSVWVDTADILPTSEWRQDIIDAIEATSAVLFVLSPDWVASEVSQRELQYAVEMKKKLIPVVYRDVDHRLVNPALANLNWIFARPTDDPNRALQQIVFAIDADLAFWREGSDLLVKARQWEQSQRNPTFTLRGDPLRKAEQWLASSATKNASPSALQVEYITAGRRASAARQRTTIGALTGGIIITLVLAIISASLAGTLNVANVSLKADNKTLSAGAIAAKANEQLVNNKFDSALLLAQYGFKQHPDATTTDSLFNALEYSPNIESQLQTDQGGGFDASAFTASYASDGKSAMTASPDGHVIIWDMATHRLRSQFTVAIPPDNPNAFIAADYSLDGKYVATDIDKQGGGIQLRDAATGAIVATFSTPFVDASNFHTLIFSHDSKYLATSLCADDACSTQQIVVWNISAPNTPRYIHIIPIQGYNLSIGGGIRNVRFSPDDHLLAVSQCDDTNQCLRSRLDLFDTATFGHSATLTMSLVAGESPQGQVWTFAFSPDSSQIAMGGIADQYNKSTSKIFFWNIAHHQFTQQTIIDADTGGGLETLAFSSDGQNLATGEINNGRIKLWSLIATQPILYSYQFRGHTNTIDALAFSPDGEHFISIALDGRIILWRLRPFTSLSQPNGFLAMSPDGTLNAIANGNTHQITILHAATNTVQTTIPYPAEGLFSLAISPNNKTLAAGFVKSEVRLWDISSGKQIGDTLIDAPAVSNLLIEIMTNVTFSPDSAYLLSTSLEDVITVREVATQQIIYQYINSTGGTQPYTGAFSADGKYLAFGNGANAVQVLDLAAGKVTTQLAGHNAPVLAAAFNHNGSMLASLDITGKIIFWDMKTQKPIGSPVFDKTPVTITPNLAFSPDGALLVSSHDAIITIWNVMSRNLYITPIATSDYVIKTSFSADGKYLSALINGAGTDVRDIKSSDWPNLACDIANRNLAQDEWTQLLGGIPNVPSQAQKVCAANP